MPKAREYEGELVSIRDKLFGDLIKGVATWEFPTISIAYFGNFGFTGAVAAFEGSSATFRGLCTFKARRCQEACFFLSHWHLKAVKAVIDANKAWHVPILCPPFKHVITGSILPLMRFRAEQ